MYKKYFRISLLVLALFVIQHSLITRLDARLIFWPAIISFIIIVFGHRLGLIWGLIIGFLLDIFSPLIFGSHLMIFFLITIVIYLLAKNFLTDRSVMSFIILSLTAALIYVFLLYLIQMILIKLAGQNQIFNFNLKSLFIFLGANLVLILILFLFTLKFSKKLETNILMR
ncbi:hypothetical protein COU23_01985 [Candidatus Kuenenbacteria bacterium CG10_big_fil_rev_8_21_14_0_10_36_11]|uniref:Uncharacterized protein n=1 Tax=Candidatus Kuenenbacteria bacterium CG10_big_fil_rev_8_21_14_0_10_36_11 TaxID=1974618 RepID=A0A2M6WAK8_9BACT|nr:MAG: hypothetical protein COU23_01985 [Candidatus Kuenenbacteria bacterium CG10_big_fil_rev_8_21_14_0_10_36_11]